MQHKNERTEYLIKITGTVIKKLREKKIGLSLNKFALETEIGKGNMSRLESGLNDPKLTTLWRISEGLGIPLSEFIKILEQELPEDWDLLEK